MLTAASLCVVPSTPAWAGFQATTLALGQNFPDPDIVKAGAVYHAYATNGDGKHIQHAVSGDLVR